MKRITLLLLLVTTLSSPLTAQLAKGDFLIGAGVSGRATFGNRSSLWMTLHPEFQYMIGNRVSIGLYTRLDFAFVSRGDNWDGLLWGHAAPEARFWFGKMNSRFQFYAFANAGISGLLHSSQGMPIPYNDKYFIAQAGIGALWWARPNTAVQVRLNVIQYSTLESRTHVAPMMQFGVIQRFSAKPKANTKSTTLSFD